MWSPPLETFQASLKEPLGLLHRADHHTFPKCKDIVEEYFNVFFYGCRLNVKALMDEPIVVVLLLLCVASS
jgi:hypothetical protein